MVYTSPLTKSHVILYKREGKSNRETMFLMGIDPATVRRIYRRYHQNEDYHSIKPKPGRRWILRWLHWQAVWKYAASYCSCNCSQGWAHEILGITFPLRTFQTRPHFLLHFSLLLCCMYCPTCFWIIIASFCVPAIEYTHIGTFGHIHKHTSPV